MHANDNSKSFEDQLREAYPDLSEAELKLVFDGYHYTGCQKTDKIATDLDGEPEPEPPYRRALAGRYWIFRKLHEPERDYWDNYNEDFYAFSAHLPHEPAIIATALAFRPTKPTDWEAVEAWSWIFSHALMLDIGLDEFEEWCSCWTAARSRNAVLLELMREGSIAALRNELDPSVYDAANGNA